jgi:glycosyltransferase involved in cell wall biosynthesis
MLRRARAVQVLDDRHADFLKRLGVQTQIIATCNGFSPEDVCPAERLRWSVDGAIKLLFLGRIDAFNKGLDLLIQAMPGALERAGARLTIQGPDWGDLDELQKLARQRESAPDIIRFLPPDYQKRPWQIIAEHDVLCLPSRFEGFGLAALEAMLAARVLVVSEIAGIARHVRASGCGVVVEPSAEAICDSVSSLISRRHQWKEMGLAGREYALKNLQWDRIAEDALREYVRLGSR